MVTEESQCDTENRIEVITSLATNLSKQYKYEAENAYTSSCFVSEELRVSRK